MEKENQTNCGAEGPLVPGGMALRLFIRDATGIPTAINLQAYWAALRDRDFLTCGTAERIREIESVLDQVSPEDASLLLLCASDVAMAADRYMEAEILREASLSEALEMDPSVDPETREFLDSLASWPSRDTQPPEVTHAIDHRLAVDSVEPDALVRCRGRSIADFFEGELQYVLTHEGWECLPWGFLPNEAYGYFMPVILEKVLRPRGRLAADAAGVLRHFGPWLDPSANRWLGGRGDARPLIVQTTLDGYTPLQRETLFRFLQLVRRRPDIDAFNCAQLEAAVCYHFFWKDRTNWAVEG